MSRKTGIPCRAIGVIPRETDSPRLFFDVDNEDKKIRSALINYVSQKNSIHESNHKHWAIYKTKHGYHLVAQRDSWEQVKLDIITLKGLMKSDYMSDDEIQLQYMLKQIPNTMRLRISSKWIIKENGKVDSKTICPEPLLSNSCTCYEELRVGIKEVYDCYD